MHVSKWGLALSASNPQEGGFSGVDLKSGVAKQMAHGIVTEITQDDIMKDPWPFDVSFMHFEQICH